MQLSKLLVILGVSLSTTSISGSVGMIPRQAAAVAGDSLEFGRARHALNRLAYGPRPGEVERVMALGVDRWIEQQLNPESIADTQLDERLAGDPSLDLTTDDLAEMFIREQRERQRRQRARADTSAAAMALEPRQPFRSELRRATARLQQLAVTRAVLSERQLYEVMVDFWTNHFNVFLGKGALRYLTADYIRNVIRPNALGRFEDLLVATAQSPAMMFYLDNAQSIAPGSRPPELAEAERRLERIRRRRRSRTDDRIGQMERRLTEARGRLPRGLNENYARELLELHTLGVDGGYTQDDIIEVARVFTGWSIARPARRGTAFAFNAWAHDGGAKTVLGREFPAGAAMDEGVALLELLARHPATARHISTKLCTKFVSDDPPQGCIEAGATAWQASDGNIREVVRAVVTSPDFWDPGNRGAKTKTPLEFVVSAVRALGGEPDSTPQLHAIVARLGQPLYLRQPPDGYPETHESWVNAGALLNRLNIALRWSGNRTPGMIYDREQLVPATHDLDQMLASVNATVLSGSASPTTLRIMREQAALARDPQQRRSMLIAYALGSPEFQRQ